jgi:hypothetical protein
MFPAIFQYIRPKMSRVYAFRKRNFDQGWLKKTIAAIIDHIASGSRKLGLQSLVHLKAKIDPI